MEPTGVPFFKRPIFWVILLIAVLLAVWLWFYSRPEEISVPSPAEPSAREREQLLERLSSPQEQPVSAKERERLAKSLTAPKSSQSATQAEKAQLLKLLGQ